VRILQSAIAKTLTRRTTKKYIDSPIAEIKESRGAHDAEIVNTIRRARVVMSVNFSSVLILINEVNFSRARPLHEWFDRSTSSGVQF
jgi:hypothetical protein